MRVFLEEKLGLRGWRSVGAGCYAAISHSPQTLHLKSLSWQNKQPWEKYQSDAVVGTCSLFFSETPTMQSPLFATIHLSQYGSTHSSLVLQFITAQHQSCKHRKNLDNISLYRGVKLVSRKMVGLDDLPITSSESEFTASSGGKDVYELYEWFSRMGVDHLKSSSRKLSCHRCKYKHSVILMCSNFLMSIKTERELVFCYCKGTRRHINRMNTICTLFILKQTKLQQN